MYKSTKSQMLRLLDLDRRIRRGEYPSAVKMAQVWECNRRTISRDVEFLRDSLGAPLAYDRMRRGYFYSRRYEFAENAYVPA